MIINIIICLCAIVSVAIVAYSLGYEAGLRHGFFVMNTRINPEDPICGRTMKPIDGIQEDEAQ